MPSTSTSVCHCLDCQHDTSTGPDLTDSTALGRHLVTSGELRRIREKVGVSSTVQAHMMNVQPIQLHSWEAGKSAPSRRSAGRVTEWYRAAMDKLSEPGVLSGDLVHVSVATQMLGTSYATLVDWCRRGLISCFDLGMFGTYVPREQVTLSE